MSTLDAVDVIGRRRSPATFPEFHLGRPPRNKGLRYPADPPRVEEIVAVMREAGEGIGGLRLRGLIAVLWRAGLRIQEALDLGESDLDPRRGALLIRSGKNGARREVGMDDWGWEHLSAWSARRLELPPGPVFCIVDGPTRGRRGLRPVRAASYADSPRGQASDGGSRRTSCVTRTRSSSHARAFRST